MHDIQNGPNFERWIKLGASVFPFIASLTQGGQAVTDSAREGVSSTGTMSTTTTTPSASSDNNDNSSDPFMQPQMDAVAMPVAAPTEALDGFAAAFRAISASPSPTAVARCGRAPPMPPMEQLFTPFAIPSKVYAASAPHDVGFSEPQHFAVRVKDENAPPSTQTGPTLRRAMAPSPPPCGFSPQLQTANLVAGPGLALTMAPSAMLQPRSIEQQIDLLDSWNDPAAFDLNFVGSGELMLGAGSLGGFGKPGDVTSEQMLSSLMEELGSQSGGNARDMWNW